MEVSWAGVDSQERSGDLAAGGLQAASCLLAGVLGPGGIRGVSAKYIRRSSGVKTGALGAFGRFVIDYRV